MPPQVRPHLTEPVAARPGSTIPSMTIEPYADQFLLAALDISGGDVQEFLGTDQVLHAAELDEAQRGRSSRSCSPRDTSRLS